MEAGSVEHVEAMMESDCVYWALRKGIKLIGGIPFTVDDRPYIKDIMRDEAEEMALMKGAQSAGTTCCMLMTLHKLAYGICPQGAIYYFPTERSVEAFSKTRFSPLITDNACIRKFLKGTKSVNIKRVGKTFLRLLGASATKSIQGKKDGTSVRSEPADILVRDETDLFDNEMREETKQRILNSKNPKEIDLGTPTIPDYGISKIYYESDQKRWQIACKHCSGDTCLVDEFPNCIKYKDGKAYFACIHCEKEIFPVGGRWVAKCPGRRVSGYLVSHLITPNCKLDKIMARWERDQKEGNIGEFYNAILGLPYIPLEDRLRQQDVLDCCNNELMETASVKGTAMGVDIGKISHVVIAQKNGKKTKIIYVGQLPTSADFSELTDLATRFNVKSCVIDLRPYENSVRGWQIRHKGSIKIFAAEYKDKQRTLSKVDDQSGTYSIGRTEIMDRTHTLIKSGTLSIPRKCEAIKEFSKQCCATAKVLEVNERTGDKMYRYRALGDEHYRHCLNYLHFALLNLHEYEINPQMAFAGAEKEYDPLTWGL